MSGDITDHLKKMYADMIASLHHQKSLMEREIFLTRDGNADDTRAQLAICERHIEELEGIAARISSRA